MSKILRKLSYLAFPECSRQALQYLTTCVTSANAHDVSIPGLDGADHAAEVCHEYILFNSGGRRGGIQKLNSIQELNLLEMISTCLDQAPQSSRYRIFVIIFGGSPDPQKINLFTKLVSMALSLSVGSVLDCAALWMQEHGCHSKAVCDLSHKLVEDYCILFTDVSKTFQKLPTVSALFTCNFITAVTSIYPFNGNIFQRPPPLGLLQYITNWISSDPCLCFESVRLIRIQANFSCPLSGLVQWCILGHLVMESRHSSSSNFSDSDRSKTIDILSKLHFGVLQSLQAYRSMELNQELFTMSQFVSLSQTLMQIVEKEEFQNKDSLNMLVERIGQMIQVAILTKSLKVNGKFL
ncbi:hypothetical protein FSP39_021248 [Pinctada imbricata]|uniref:Uncharacterized protein n=1 Tax=Pinctada imbricata TaxID=66713 RepID=A0AA89C279_PINIB|nr:hypothetical protein FSP39_021248 [Pinctada imbricata]